MNQPVTLALVMPQVHQHEPRKFMEPRHLGPGGIKPNVADLAWEFIPAARRSTSSWITAKSNASTAYELHLARSDPAITRSESVH